MAKKLEVRNLTISFRTNNGAVRAVRDISFDLEEGETLAIAGESGSGKSVTTRAIMGILAGNAMVDGGEIIYDGKDLLKIPEEDFHTLRGHKLSMVFQDPLSALNPIMRIGKQLTEAMILNNKERQADGKRCFKSMLSQLKKNMVKAGTQAGASQTEAEAQVKAKLDRFGQILPGYAQLENGWKLAKERAEGMLDAIEETELAIIAQNVSKVRQLLRQLADESSLVINDWVIPQSDAAFSQASAAVARLSRDFTMPQEKDCREQLEALKKRLNEAVRQNGETPDFFSIAFLKQNGGQLTAGEDIAALNARARRKLEDEFMGGFRKDVCAALAASAQEADGARASACAALREALPVFREEPLNQQHCKAAADKASDAVEKAIDPLALEKDSQAYVYRSSMLAEIARYFEGVKSNPKEIRRFEKQTEQHDRLVASGKAVPSVIPMNLVDLDRVRATMLRNTEQLADHLESLQGSGGGDLNERADAMIRYLCSCYYDSTYRLSMATAKHRAIQLMKEVGIPEPQKRYTQYPFEFSGGMRQRIVIAIALSANPDILICDEPTTALDVTIQAQILELINQLKRERRLSVIFITHDLGVVANMADKIAIMYAGKIVEYGTADDIFYDPRHPYTWALLASMPDLETEEKLDAIPGTPPNMILPPKGDAFAVRNQYAMDIDFEEQPPMFRISDTHQAATWLLHPNAPKVSPPAIVTARINRILSREVQQRQKNQEGSAEI